MTSDLDRARPDVRPTAKAASPERQGERRSSSASLRRSWEWAALLLLALAGALMMAHLTRKGIGLWEDSFDYITAARSLVESGRLGRIDGFGNFRPLTHFPPAYPWALALLNLAGIDIYDAARWLNVGLYGAVILLSGAGLRWAAGSVVWGLMGAGLVLSSEVLIGVHLWALTEPLYLALALGAILLAAGYLGNPGRRGFLHLAAFTSAFALLTRYAGAATVITVALALATLPGRARARKWQDALVFLMISCLPLLAFMARNRIISGAPIDYPRAAWHWPPASEWEVAARTLLNWGLPDVVVEHLSGRTALAVSCVWGFLSFLGAVWLLRRLRRDLRAKAEVGSAIGILFPLYGGAYLLVFLASGILVRTVVLTDTRLLAPLYVALAAILVTALAQVWRNAAFAGRMLVVGLCVVIAGFQVWRLSGLVEVLPGDSRGFASNAWRQSETIAFLRTLPQTTIYSNEIQTIYFLTGITGIFVPTPDNPATDQPREDYADSLAEMRLAIHRDEGVLALFASPEEFESEYFRALAEGLTLLGRFSDGAVLGNGDA